MSTRAEPGALRTRLLAGGFAYAPAVALAVLLPKCPLCIAAPLALLGLSVSLPSYLRVLAVVVSAVLGTVFLVVRTKRSCGCGPGKAHCAARSARIALGRSRIV